MEEIIDHFANENVVILFARVDLGDRNFWIVHHTTRKPYYDSYTYKKHCLETGREVFEHLRTEALKGERWER